MKNMKMCGYMLALDRIMHLVELYNAPFRDMLLTHWDERSSLTFLNPYTLFSSWTNYIA